MVCFVLRPGPPPTGLKPPLINYTSTSTTVATTPLDFMDNESLLPDNVVYDEMMVAGGGPVELEPLQPAVTEEMMVMPTEDPYNGTGGAITPLIYEDGNGGTVNLHGKSSSSDRGKHRNTWNQANRTVRTNYTFNYNKVINMIIIIKIIKWAANIMPVSRVLLILCYPLIQFLTRVLITLCGVEYALNAINDHLLIIHQFQN
jgi:hypothetical protein